MTTPLSGASRPTQGYDLERRKRALGQVFDASAAGGVVLYTCPVQRIAIGRVYVCNRSTAATIRIRIKTDTDGDGTIDADADAQVLVYDYPIPANEYDYTEELWLSASDTLGGASDLIEVKASTANVSFTFNGYTIPKDTT